MQLNNKDGLKIKYTDCYLTYSFFSFVFKVYYCGLTSPCPRVMETPPRADLYLTRALDFERARVSGRGGISEGAGGCSAIRSPGGRGGGAVGTGHQKHLCHLQSPARVRNVRPPRAHVVFCMRPLYF